MNENNFFETLVRTDIPAIFRLSKLCVNLCVKYLVFDRFFRIDLTSVCWYYAVKVCVMTCVNFVSTMVVECDKKRRILTPA
jgi:hypothetical protein